MDVGVAAIGLLLLSPFFAVIAALVKLQDGGPVFYRATRVGKGGDLFKLYKFRTMVVDADRVGPGVTFSGDNRTTRIGRFLRRAKLDELPQLVNVLAGDMSLVGPRPEDPRYVALYTPEQRQVLSVRPGITSAASIIYRYEEQLLSGSDPEAVYRYVILPSKLKTDLDYLYKRNVWSDVRLILRTAAAIFRP
jgi:lipopolysaccharide/colanic/teichoic acid biosynthesis glycosyltransferase